MTKYAMSHMCSYMGINWGGLTMTKMLLKCGDPRTRDGLHVQPRAAYVH